MLVVEARPARGDGGDAFDVAPLGTLATLLVTPSGEEHLLLSNGVQRLQIDIVSGTLREGPVDLVYRLDDGRRAKLQMQALVRFLALRRHRTFQSWLTPPEARGGRWIRQLRVHDAIVAGASERQIAIALFGAGAVVEQWKEGSGPLRSAVQRLVRRARANVDGGYKMLLTKK